MPSCPYCAETIDARLPQCPYCRSDLTQPVRRNAATAVGGVRPAKSGISGWIILLIVGGVLGMIAIPIAIMIALLLPAVQGARDAASRAYCMNNMKQIGLALHSYHDKYGTFPPAYVADKDGKLMHSWRVLILPELGESHVYKMYDFSKPWDSTENQRVLNMMPNVYRCPTDAGRGGGYTMTSYAAAFGPNCVFRGAAPVRLSDIVDGPANTILVSEASGAAIPWTTPKDVDITMFPRLGDPRGFSSSHEHACNVLFADASIRVLSESTDEDKLRAMYSINGGEVVVPSDLEAN